MSGAAMTPEEQRAEEDRRVLETWLDAEYDEDDTPLWLTTAWRRVWAWVRGWWR